MATDNTQQLPQEEIDPADVTPDDVAQQPASQSPDDIDPSQATPDEETDYTTPGQQAIAGLEGLGRGAIPAFNVIETGLGVSPQGIAGRETGNPGTAGTFEAAGLIGSAFIPGIGEGALLTTAGQIAAETAGLGKAITEASNVAKIGSAAVKGAVEAGLFSANKKINDYISGKEDPNEPASAALSNLGYSSLIGGGVGAGLGVIGLGASSALQAASQTEMGAKASQFLADLGNGLKNLKENPDPVQAMTDELQNYHASTSDASSELWATGGIKDQARQKLCDNLDPDDIASHVKLVSSLLDNAPEELQSYKPFQQAAQDWKSKAVSSIDPITLQSTGGGSAAEINKASDILKKQMQEWSDYDATNVKTAEVPFRNAASSLSSSLRKSLEDTGVWGDMGDLQKSLNSATSKFIPANKDFLQTFTQKELGDPTVSPSRVNTYMNQLGSAKLGLKGSKLGTYLDAAETYRGQVNAAYGKAGLDSPFVPTSLNVTKSTLSGDISPGAQLAKQIHNNLAGLVGEGAALGVAGAAEPTSILSLGLAKILKPIFTKVIGNRVSDTTISTLIKCFATGDAAGAGQAFEHAANVNSGKTMIKNAVGSLFQLGGAQASAAAAASRHERDKEKIRSFVENGGVNAQMQNQIQDQQKQHAAEQQSTEPAVTGFADGGEVVAKKQHNSPADNSKDHIANVFPGQAPILSAAKVRVYNYLNSIRPIPKPTGALPFDDAHEDESKKREYDTALGYAASPLSIVKKVKDGTLAPNDMKHFTSMWPEIHNELSKKTTEALMKAQLKGNAKPPFATRQAMSMFMGTNLESSLTPSSIMAAQSVFNPQPQSPMPAGSQNANKPKKNTSKLDKLPNQYQTPGQAAEARQVAKS